MMKQKNTTEILAKEKEDILITRENLLEEIGALLKDEFVAEVSNTPDGIEMQFLSGQTFIVSIKQKEA